MTLEAKIKPMMKLYLMHDRNCVSSKASRRRALSNAWERGLRESSCTLSACILYTSMYTISLSVGLGHAQHEIIGGSARGAAAANGSLN